MDAILTYRKRVITPDDLSFVREVIDEHQKEGRSAISRRLCEAWNWRQDNGQLKDGVCRGLLLQLERNQHITLPPRLAVNNNSERKKKIPVATLFASPMQVKASLRDIAPIELHQVRRSPEEKLFNTLVRQYHYLGYSQPVGEHLKYLAYANGRVIACFAFSSAIRHRPSRHLHRLVDGGQRA